MLGFLVAGIRRPAAPPSAAKALTFSHLGSGGCAAIAPAELDSPRTPPYLRRSVWHSGAASAKASIPSLSINGESRSDGGSEEIMAKLKFRPLHDRVVVKRIEAEEKSKGGIIIPDTAKEKPQEGEVVAVGPGGRDENGKLITMGVKAGDRVLFGKWSGTEVKLDGDELLIMKESDIMGVIA
jgi:chaperonin GroES